MQRELETLSKTNAEAKGWHAKDLGETRDTLRKKIKECDALKANVGKLGKELTLLRDALKKNEKKIVRFKLQITLDT